MKGFWSRNREKTAGFSLLELSAVVSVLMILSLIAVPIYKEALNKSRYALVLTRSKLLSSGFEEYYLAYGVYPDESVASSSPFVGDGLVTLKDPLRASFAFQPLLAKGYSPTLIEDPFCPAAEPDCSFYYIRSTLLHDLFPAESHVFRDRGVLISCGPDRVIERPSGMFIYHDLLFDASNGMKSQGDIVLSFPRGTAVK